MVSTLSLVFPPSPTFTDRNLPSLAGKVIIITGAASGVGFELAKMLYAAGATVYIAARSDTRCNGAIDKLKTQVQFGRGKSVGRLEKMVVDLSDLRTIKGAAEEFLRREERLDVLVNNAAVMDPPKGSKDVLGHDLEIGTNCLGPYLLTLLLEPILIRTAATLPPSSVRIVWVATMLQSGGTPPSGMLFDKTGTPEILSGMNNYFQSKAGTVWIGAEFAKRLGERGILSVSLHPGLMKTELQRSWGPAKRFLMAVSMKGPVYGAYTELFAGFSPDLNEEHNGGFLTAWGRVSELPENLRSALKSKANGGSGTAAKFMEYCDREIESFK